MPKKFGTPGPRLMMPTVCTSVPLASCSIEAQLLFDRLIAQADDQGRLQGEPRVVAALCMPLIAAASDRRVARWLDEIAASTLIERYESNGRQLIQLRGWWENQGTPRRAYPSRYPAPEGWTDRVRVDGEPPQSADIPPPDRRQAAGDLAALAHAGPSLPVPSLPVPSRPSGDAPAPTWFDTEAPEGPALAWLASHGAALDPNGNGLHVKLCRLVEVRGLSAVLAALEELATNPDNREVRQFVLGADNLLNRIPGAPTNGKPETAQERQLRELVERQEAKERVREEERLRAKGMTT